MTYQEYVTRATKAEFQNGFRDLQSLVYTIAYAHGFHEQANNPLHTPTKLALIHSEVSEALEAHRKGDDAHVGEELADIVIRVMDLAEALNIDLAQEIVSKVEANQARSFRHGNKRY